MKQTKINPAKATPQAALGLRAGTKARAADAAAPPAAEPGAAPAEGADGAVDQDPNDMADAAAACRAASAACADTIKQLDTCADELEGGTDSISTLKATEEACATADDALDEAATKCAGLRGVEPPADSERTPGMPPMPPPAPGARLGARAAQPTTVTGHLEVARLAQLGSALLRATGKSDPEAALGVMEARFAAAAQVGELRRRSAAQEASADASERTTLFEKAIALGTAPALIYDVTEGPKGEKVRAETEWAKGQSTEQLRAFVDTTKTLGGFALGAGAKTPDARQEGAALASLTAAERDYCARTGRDPAAFAQTKSTLFGAQGAGKEA